MLEQASSSRPSSSERSSSSGHQMDVKEGMESDEEIRRVPELGLEPGGASTSGRDAGGPERAQSSTALAGARRRGRSTADKEHKRLKRLLRNRVSAQQARERKKAYLTDLEVKVKDLEKKNSELEERFSTMQNENQMLRQVDSSACLSRVERSVAGAAARHVPRSKSCVQPSLRASIHPLKEQRSSRGDRRSGAGQCPLLPGLPDDLAVACLVRVPRAEHWRLRLVCRRWFRLLAGNYFYGLRRRLGLAEQWVYAVRCDGDGHVSWGVLDPARGAWRELPPVPGEYGAAAGFGCAVLGGCHLYLFGGRDPRRGAMWRVVFYSARSSRWHRAPDMLRRRHCFGACVIGNRLYVAGGESGGGGGGLRSAEVFDPAKNRWSFVSDMAAAVVPFVSMAHGGKWYVKGLGADRQVLSQVYSPETDAWSVVLDSMVTGWRSPSACLNGRLYAADCKDGCRLRAYDEATDAWSGCIDSRRHLGSSHASEAAAMVALDGKLCVVRNDMSVSVVDFSAEAGNRRWKTVAGRGQIGSFVTNLLSRIADHGRRSKNRVLHCQVLEA